MNNIERDVDERIRNYIKKDIYGECKKIKVNPLKIPSFITPQYWIDSVMDIFQKFYPTKVDLKRHVYFLMEREGVLNTSCPYLVSLYSTAVNLEEVYLNVDICGSELLSELLYRSYLEEIRFSTSFLGIEDLNEDEIKAIKDFSIHSKYFAFIDECIQKYQEYRRSLLSKKELKEHYQNRNLFFEEFVRQLKSDLKKLEQEKQNQKKIVQPEW